MSSQPISVELCGLLAQLAGGTTSSPDPSPETVESLNDVLATDAQAQQVLIEYLMLDVCLEILGNSDEDEAFDPEQGIDEEFGDNTSLLPLPIVTPIITDQQSELFCPQSSPPSPTSSPFSFLTTSYHGTVGLFSQEVPFAILMATFFMIVGGLVGWYIPHEHFTQITGRSSSSAGRSFADVGKADKPIPSEEEVTFVGRITGMVDVKWSDDKEFLPPSGNFVALGRKYKLDSGLMEITYNTGAKVILQGPVTYQVESANSGYMPVGKLTARVEKKGRGGEGETGKAEAANLPSPNGRGVEGEGSSPSSSQSALTPAFSQGAREPDTSPFPLPPSALFAIRTPNAVITDLGTEFGVEVSKEGLTESRVLRGSVAVRWIAADGKTIGEEVVLHKNDTVQVGKPNGGSHQPSFVVCRNTSEPMKFVSDMPMQVLAHFRLGEDELGAAPGSAVGLRIRSHGQGILMENHGSFIYTADTGAPRSTLAIDFSGASGGCLVAPSLFTRVPDRFILEAWARTNSLAQKRQLIACIGDSGSNSYGLYIEDGQWRAMLGALKVINSVARCEARRWTHLILVRERFKWRFLVDGQMTEASIDDAPPPPPGPFSIGGDYKYAPQFTEEQFQGQIDEVRLSTFQGAFQTNMLENKINKTKR